MKGQVRQTSIRSRMMKKASRIKKNVSSRMFRSGKE